jgi:hypothetical protein
MGIRILSTERHERENQEAEYGGNVIASCMKMKNETY